MPRVDPCRLPARGQYGTLSCTWHVATWPEPPMDLLFLLAFAVTALVGTLVAIWVVPALVVAALVASIEDLLA